MGYSRNAAQELVFRMANAVPPGRRVAPAFAIAGAALTVAAACRHVTPPASPPQPSAVAAPVAPGGAVSVRYLVAPGAPTPGLSENQRLVAPFPLARPLPEYPPEALAAAAPLAVVAVRILIATSGRVGSIVDSPLAASTPGPLAPAFRAAVEAALAGWEFYPAHVDTYRDRDGDGDGVAEDDELVDYAPVEVFYDLAFEFSIVDGRGAVRLAPPP